MLTRRLILLAGLAVLAAPAARADVKPHPLFTDNMVLQRGVACPIWGTADPGENVTVTVDAASKDEKTSIKLGTTARDDGWWMVRVGTFQGGDKLTVTIAGKNKVVLKNVLAGDVWVCSGQSNMEWRLKQLTIDDQGKKVAEKAANPKLRLFTVPNITAATPQKNFPVSEAEGRWLECTPETVINFSAIGYFFGTDLAKNLDVPIGLISSDWGGTPAEAWTSKEGLMTQPPLHHYIQKAETAVKMQEAFDAKKAKTEYEAKLKGWKAAAAKSKKNGKPAPRRPVLATKSLNPHTPSTLYNGMIAPLVPFAVTGAIWYQGESNAGRAAEYYTLMPALIQDWRAKWGTDLPFLMVQLAPFKGGASGVDYAELRDAQLHTAKLLPKVGLAVITDVGHETDIHPQEKAPVGKRLALAARAIAYGQKVEFSGPVYQSARYDGSKAVVTFNHADGGLAAKGGELNGFTVAGADGKFHPAKAEIQGNTVVLSSEKVQSPNAVRYGWVNFAKPELNLFNKSGLPAVPFRTDSLPLTTAPKK